MIFAVYALCCAIGLQAQKPLTGCPALLFHSSQLTDTLCDRSIKKIRLTSSGKVKVKLQNGDVNYFSQDSFWGIRQRNENPVRFYQGRNYSVDKLLPVVQYSRQAGRLTNYYFSIAPDSPVYSFNKAELKQYADSATYAAVAEEAKKNRREISIDFYALNTKFLNNRLWGGGMEIKYYPQRKWATGLSISIAGKNITDTFGFSIAKPLINYFEIGWLNQYEILQTQAFRVGVNLTNGFAVANLRDRTQLEKRHTRYGDQNVPKKIAANYYYLLQPGMDLSYKLIPNNHDPGFFINAKARYSLGFGKKGFGGENVFTGYRFSIGLSLIGFDREQF